MLLSENQIRESVKKSSGWTFEGGRLTKTHKFLDFVRAVLFINKLVNPIEEHQSYPQIEVSYNTAKIMLYNHQCGGITETEIQMMEEIDVLAAT